jgi:ribose transport system ATP-binding protein
VSLLSEDRKSEGLAQSLSCVSNVTLPAMTRASRFGFLAPLGALQSCGELARRLKIRWSSPRQKVGQLSGGNQQKVAFARLLYCDANVLLLDEPTRGIDVASKVDLYRVIRDLAGAGKAVVIVSSYLPELLGVCDEVAVMVRGRLTATTPTQDLTPEHVMGLAVGQHD